MMPKCSAILLLVCVACRSRGADAVAVDSARAATTSAPAQAPADSAISYTAPSDASVFALLDDATATDSSLGALAATKATASDLRKFAKLTMGDQHALRVAARTLASELGITPIAQSGELVAQAKQREEKLGAMPGSTAWDTAYVTVEVTYLTQLVEVLAKLLPAVRSAQLKTLIEEALPTLQAHLALARDLAAR